MTLVMGVWLHYTSITDSSVYYGTHTLAFGEIYPVKNTGQTGLKHPVI